MWKWKSHGESKLALKIGWFFLFIVPFAVLLFFPYRLTIDWEKASESLCVQTIDEMNDSGAIKLFSLSRNQGIRAVITPELLKEEPKAATYCGDASSQWTNQLSTDLLYLQCEYQEPPDDYCCDLRGMTPKQCEQRQANIEQAVEIDLSSSIAVNSYLVQLQAMVTSATTALENSRLALGIYMGLFGVKLLLPPTLGLVNGLSAALVNVKLQLPMSRVVSYLIVISTCVKLPLFGAFLAAVFQVVGTEVLIGANSFALLALGMFATPCSRRLLFPYTTASVRSGSTLEQLRRYCYLLLLAEAFTYACAGAFLVAFVYSKPDLLHYLSADTVLGLWPQGVMVLVGALSIARLTRVAGVDTLLMMLGDYLEPLQTMRKRQRRRKGEDFQRMRELSKESNTGYDADDNGVDWTHPEDELEMRMTLDIVLQQKEFLQEEEKTRNSKYTKYMTGKEEMSSKGGVHQNGQRQGGMSSGKEELEWDSDADWDCEPDADDSYAEYLVVLASLQRLVQGKALKVMDAMPPHSARNQSPAQDLSTFSDDDGGCEGKRLPLPLLLNPLTLFGNLFKYIKQTHTPRLDMRRKGGGGDDVCGSQLPSSSSQGVGFMAKLLYWRYSTMLWLVIGFIGTIVLGFLELEQSRVDYQRLVDQTFPERIKKFGDGFALALWYADAALLALLMLPALLSMAGLCSWRRFGWSVRCMRWCWYLLNAVPFMLLLFIPFRLFVDYEKASQELCAFTFSELENEGTFGLIEDYVTVPDLAATSEAKADLGFLVDPHGFCAKHGSDWLDALDDDFATLGAALNYGFQDSYLYTEKQGQASSEQSSSEWSSATGESALEATFTAVLADCNAQGGQFLPVGSSASANNLFSANGSTYVPPLTGVCNIDDRGGWKLCGSCLSTPDVYGDAGSTVDGGFVGRYYYGDDDCTGEPLFRVRDKQVCEAEETLLELGQREQACAAAGAEGGEEGCKAEAQEQDEEQVARAEVEAEAGESESMLAGTCVWVGAPAPMCSLRVECRAVDEEAACRRIGCDWTSRPLQAPPEGEEWEGEEWEQDGQEEVCKNPRTSRANDDDDEDEDVNDDDEEEEKDVNGDDDDDDDEPQLPFDVSLVQILQQQRTACARYTAEPSCASADVRGAECAWQKKEVGASGGATSAQCVLAASCAVATTEKMCASGVMDVGACEWRPASTSTVNCVPVRDDDVNDDDVNAGGRRLGSKRPQTQRRQQVRRQQVRRQQVPLEVRRLAIQIPEGVQAALLVSTLEAVQIKAEQTRSLIENFEYALGTVMGLYAMRLLLPIAVGMCYIYAPIYSSPIYADRCRYDQLYTIHYIHYTHYTLIAVGMINGLNVGLNNMVSEEYIDRRGVSQHGVAARALVLGNAC
jgi:hypothetical protein